ncbi:glycoside hydrolase family 172 protein [Phenylobacterium sp.]|uniref:glycoside hydrolase family 172 protein n=1 Tax=Phenylobacterium sp. TaxID=1871053 RepID=UPI0025D28242|nr:glycoside hydrolase family 172 protein [Phenylobacterium sp.]
MICSAVRVAAKGAGLAMAMLAFAATGAAARPPVGDLYRLSDAESRSISPENLTGEKGGGSRTPLDKGSAGVQATDLGLGWKVNPYIEIPPGGRTVLGEASGPGIINHIWMTIGGKGTYRSMILRIYWDGEATPSVETPVGDFFAAAFGKESTALIDSAVVAVNPESGLNSFWQMPFRRKFRIELENRSQHTNEVYYQIDYALQDVPPDAAYFHAQFRQVDRLKPKDVYVLLDGVKGRGHYVGTYLTHSAFSPGWWGEGEFKFYLDGDRDFPTINYTGEEDYFLGSYGYRHRGTGRLEETDYSTAYSGFHAHNKTDMATQYYMSGRERRIGEYRWHILDPIRFKSDLRVTVQALGWKSPLRYRPLDDGFSSVAFWYQAEPHAAFPKLPDDAALQFKPLVEPARPAFVAGGPLTIDSPIEAIMMSWEGREIVNRELPALATHPAYEQFKAMSLRDLQGVSEGAITDKALATIDAALKAATAKPH